MKKSPVHMVLGVSLGIFAAAIAPSTRGSAPQITNTQLRLPETDSHYRASKSYIEEVPEGDYRHPSPEAFEAFEDMKYGVRIHWGLYSMDGKRGESWPFLSMDFAEKQQYQERYKSWNPSGFNAEEWMRLFKENGVEMFAFTTKHHDGFSLFDTKTRVKQRVNWTASGGPKIEDCDLSYSIMEGPYRRDIVRELCDAGRKHGLKIDLYYSNPDWYDADFRPYGWHPLLTPGAKTNPELWGGRAFVDRKKNPTIYVMAPDPSPVEEARMIARHREQLSELLTNYGKIDMICLDNWFGKRNWPQMRETIKALRKIQPDVMFRARGINNYGDYYTPEGFVPGGKANTNMPWFVIFPLGSSFSYESDPAKHKGGVWIIQNLVDSVAKGGRFMVGIGPDGDGRFHPKVVENLAEAGAWLKVNGSAIYGTRARAGELWKEGESVRFTRSKDRKLTYAIALKWPGPNLTLRSVEPVKSSRVTLLGNDRVIDWQYSAEKGLVLSLPDGIRRTDGDPLGFAYVFQIESVAE
jgi:alpha-L-fucosidase